MIRVLVTGTNGSGKTTIAQYFRAVLENAGVGVVLIDDECELPPI